MKKTKCIYLALLAVLLSPMAANAGFILQQVSPAPTDYLFEVDFRDVTGSGVGDVTAIAEAVDWDLGLGNSSTSGCEAADFGSFTSGNIALLQRGTCSFRSKVENAIFAGAVGAILFNQEDISDRLELLRATLGQPPVSIPTLSVTIALATTVLDGATVRMLVPESVPEPGTVALFGLGLAGLGWSRRKKA